MHCNEMLSHREWHLGNEILFPFTTLSSCRPCYHSTAQAQGQHLKELAPLAAGTEPPAASRANPLLIMLAPQRHSSPVKRKQEKINECLCALHVCVYVWMHAYARIGQLSHCRKLRVLENVLEMRTPSVKKKY